MEKTEINEPKKNSIKGLINNQKFWIILLALVAIAAFIIITDWKGFTEGFDKGFNSLE